MMVVFSAGAASATAVDGTEGVDKLTGGAGDDTINGLGGNDSWLNGGFGDDTILAANGDDARDVISCGAGRDTVEADRGDKVARDCERVRR